MWNIEADSLPHHAQTLQPLVIVSEQVENFQLVPKEWLQSLIKNLRDSDNKQLYTHCKVFKMNPALDKVINVRRLRMFMVLVRRDYPGGAKAFIDRMGQRVLELWAMCQYVNL